MPTAPARITAPPAAPEVDAVVLPTGVPVGGDLFEVGSLRRAIARRMPKVTIGGDWNRPAGMLRSAVELAPGDPRLPATTTAGQPWPARAGGLLVKMAFIVARRTSGSRTRPPAPVPPTRSGLTSRGRGDAAACA